MRTVMLAQSVEQNQVSSGQIEEWMQGELASTIRHFIRKYGGTLERKLGLSKEDLENEIRLEIWKGLLTFDPKKAKLKTYFDRLIKNRFHTLYVRSELGKNNMVDYYADVFGIDRMQESDYITYDTAETFLEHRETVMQGLVDLTDLEFAIVQDIVAGENLQTMSKKHNVRIPTLIGIIGTIDRLVRLEPREES